MEQKQSSLLFAILFFFSLFIFILDRWGVFYGVRSLAEGILISSQRETRRIVFSLPFVSNSNNAQFLEENQNLKERVSQLQKLEKENEDLRLQLGVAKSDSGQKLMLAHVLSATHYFIIDKGEDDGIRVGNTVVFKNILVGKVIIVSKKTSRVLLPLEKDSVIGVKAVQTGALGNVYGQNNEMILSEVTLPETLLPGDTLQTVGNVDETGLGIRPGLLIGKITQVHKSGNLFQEAKIIPLIDYRSLQNVFIIL